ncbi:tetratricopeptide repeat protein (macronuclear) [Tetrahymena thermophila SB210]|uniref:Tetratricopeptide repeat protein n=1 Tax=Tetrahymena thermophila (strain SB210) TaxID=312017 RepID=Q22U68_TETTS|nr:tetratricopeptide repeat protein [Tetrahymena thermophila SB210]EAR88819.1 tetratricopeptide repeat protein [Tetrahymena thermophila SB210]|eukprot:XP_001009064.1 tetratricopeptide repeat protein [Tetrahymena thermophila SB210]
MFYGQQDIHSIQENQFQQSQLQQDQQQPQQQQQQQQQQQAVLVEQNLIDQNGKMLRQNQDTDLTDSRKLKEQNYQLANEQFAQIQKQQKASLRPQSAGGNLISSMQFQHQNQQLYQQMNKQAALEQQQRQLLQQQRQLLNQQKLEQYRLQQQEEEEYEEQQVLLQQQKQEQILQEQQLQQQQPLPQNSSQLKQNEQNNSLVEQIDDALIDLKIGLVQSSITKFENIIQKALIEFSDEQFAKTFIKIVKKLNFISIDYLNQGDISSSLKILTKCEQWTQPSDFGFFPDMRALTLNHIGCTHRRQNNFKKAMLFFEQALKILLNANQRSYLGITYLNLSALCSQIGQHKKGLEYARMALVESQHEFMQLVRSQSHKKFQGQLRFKNNDSQGNLQDENLNDIDDEEDLDYQNKINTLVISYHNIAAEEEYFLNYEEALIHYQNSVNTSEEYLGSQSKITQHFKQEFSKFSQRYAHFKVHNNGVMVGGAGLYPQYQNQLFSNTDQFFVVQIPKGMYQISEGKKTRILSANGKRVIRKKSSKKNKKKMIMISNGNNIPLGFKQANLSPYLQPVIPLEQVQNHPQISQQQAYYGINGYTQVNSQNNTNNQTILSQKGITPGSSSSNLMNSAANYQNISISNAVNPMNSTSVGLISSQSTKAINRPMSAAYDSYYNNQLNTTTKSNMVNTQRTKSPLVMRSMVPSQQLSPTKYQQQQQQQQTKKRKILSSKSKGLKISSNNLDYIAPFYESRGNLSYKSNVPLLSSQTPTMGTQVSPSLALPFYPQTTVNTPNQQSIQSNFSNKALFGSGSVKNMNPIYQDQNSFQSQRKLITFSQNQSVSRQLTSEFPQNDQTFYKTSRQNSNSNASELVQNNNQVETLSRIQLLENLKQQYQRAQSNVQNIQQKIQQEMQKNDNNYVPNQAFGNSTLNQNNMFDQNFMQRKYSSHNGLGQINHKKTPSSASNQNYQNQQNQIQQQIGQPPYSTLTKRQQDKFVIRNPKISQIAAGNNIKKDQQNKQNNLQNNSNQNISKQSSHNDQIDEVQQQNILIQNNSEGIAQSIQMQQQYNPSNIYNQQIQQLNNTNTDQLQNQQNIQMSQSVLLQQQQQLLLQQSSQQAIEIILEIPRIQLKELRDPKFKSFEGTLKFTLNKQRFFISIQFECEKLSNLTIEHYINVSDIFHTKDYDYSQIQQLMLAFCNEITKYLYVNLLQECLSINFQPLQSALNANNNNNKNSNNSDNNLNTQTQNIQNMIFFDKVPIKLDLKNVQRELDIVVKNNSESILLLCDDPLTAMALRMQENTQNIQQVGEDDNIKPLVNTYLMQIQSDQGDLGKIDQSQDSITPIILDPNTLMDQNLQDYSDGYKDFQLQNPYQNSRNKHNKMNGKQNIYAGNDMIPELEEADTFSQMRNNNAPYNNNGSSTISKQNQNYDGQANKDNNLNDNYDEEILDDIQDYGDDFEDNFEQQVINAKQKSTNKGLGSSRPKSSYKNRAVQEKQIKNEEPQDELEKGVGQSKYGFQNIYQLKKQQQRDNRLSQIENEFDIPNDDERFGKQKLDNFEFEDIDKDSAFQQNKNEQRFDDSANQSLEQITHTMENGNNSGRKHSTFKSMKDSTPKNDIDVNIYKVDNKIRDSSAKNQSFGEDLTSSKGKQSTQNRRNTPPPKIVINNGFDNEDPYIAYDSAQNEEKQQKEKEAQEAKEEFEKLIQEKGEKKVADAATFIQLKYKKKKNLSNEHPPDNESKDQQNQQQKQQVEEEPPIEINDENRQDFEKAANLIGSKFRMRQKNKKLEGEQQNKEQGKSEEKKKEDQQSKNNQNKEEEVVLEGPIEEYEKVASLIGGAFRKKKQREKEEEQQKIKQQQEQQQKQQNQKNEEPAVVLDGPIEEYKSVASKIENAFLMRKKRQKERQEQEQMTNGQNVKTNEDNNDALKKTSPSMFISFGVNGQNNTSQMSSQFPNNMEESNTMPVTIIDVGKSNQNNEIKKITNSTDMLLDKNSSSSHSASNLNENLNNLKEENNNPEAATQKQGGATEKQKKPVKKKAQVQANFKLNARYNQKLGFNV